MSLRILTDSACDLPEHLIEEYGIEVLPFLVYIDGQEHIDGVNITPRQVYDAIRADKVPTTGQVPMEKFLEAFTKYAKANTPCLYLSFSSKLSGTCNTARLALREVQRMYPAAQITIVDTHSGSLGQGLIVLEAAEMARAGKPAEDIIRHVQRRSQNNVEHVFSVDDLKYLYRGGRVNYSSTFLGSLLSIKPILHVKDGLMVPIQKVRGKKMAVKRIVELVKERSLGNPEQLVAISHADDPKVADQLKALLGDVLGYRRFLVNVVGSVLGCHIGLGGVAAFFVNSSYDVPNLAQAPRG